MWDPAFPGTQRALLPTNREQKPFQRCCHHPGFPHLLWALLYPWQKPREVAGPSSRTRTTAAKTLPEEAKSHPRERSPFHHQLCVVHLNQPQTLCLEHQCSLAGFSKQEKLVVGAQHTISCVYAPHTAHGSFTQRCPGRF